MVADELRRQADNFIELDELSALIARQHANGQRGHSHSPQQSAAVPPEAETTEADAS
jgi:hypothetical protein